MCANALHSSMIDTGTYNKDGDLYSKLILELYSQYPGGITLPPEYAYFVDRNMLQLLIRLARYKFVSRLLKKDDHVLEIGSGSGLGSIFMSQFCKKVTGIDVKSSEVEEARSISKRENVEFLAGDFFEMENAGNYDAVVAIDVIEHMPEETGTHLIQKIASCLGPGGMSILGSPSSYSYRYQSELSKASHVKCYDQAELMKAVGRYFLRTISFSMNDELVHTGYHKMAWYYFIAGFYPAPDGAEQNEV